MTIGVREPVLVQHPHEVGVMSVDIAEDEGPGHLLRISKLSVQVPPVRSHLPCNPVGLTVSCLTPVVRPDRRAKNGTSLGSTPP